MTAKTKKILVDIGMLVFIILSFIRWDGDPTFHLIVGTICAIFFGLHIAIHRKWLTSITKKFLKKDANKKVVRLYVVDVLLLFTWGSAIIAGILATPPFFIEAEFLSVFGRAHGVFARIALVISVIHVVQHWKQIRSYMKRPAKKA